jgi:hypothetical protein
VVTAAAVVVLEQLVTHGTQQQIKVLVVLEFLPLLVDHRLHTEAAEVVGLKLVQVQVVQAAEVMEAQVQDNQQQVQSIAAAAVVEAAALLETKLVQVVVPVLLLLNIQIFTHLQ